MTHPKLSVVKGSMVSNAIEPRISSLETAVSALTSDVSKIANAVDALRSSLSDQQRPQWGNLIAAIGVGIIVVSAIGASFISPLSIQIGYQQKVLDERGNTIESLQDRMREVENAANTNRRLADTEISTLRRDLERVDIQGSGITRERLAVIEAKLKGP